MKSNEIFFIDPLPDHEYKLNLHQHMKNDGYSLSYHDKKSFILSEIKSVLLEKGATSILTAQQLNEEVLPDNTPRSAILDTLRYKLDQCRATQDLLIIDPYLYPTSPDVDYQQYFLSIFEKTLKDCSNLHIATLSNRNTTLEQSINTAIRQLNPSISINTKYTNIFHDRFWIADGKKVFLLVHP